MTWKRTFIVFFFSFSLSAFAHANNSPCSDSEQVKGDSLQIKETPAFQGLIFFSFPKAETSPMKEEGLFD